MTDGAETWSAKIAATTERQTTENLSDLLVRLARTTDRKVTIRDIAIALQDRSFGAFLLVFALPNLVPLPPGSTFILALPLVFVAWQMAMSPGGRVFFPRVVSDYGVEPQTFEAIVKRLVPWMRWAEKLVIPRFWLFESRFAERLIGLLALILAIVVFLPIPLGNWPPAFALAVLGFAHSQRDGLGVVVGCLIGLLSLAVAGFVVYTAFAVVSLVV
ncbi:exopolysaccharide biosynthesis protein [Rhizobium glycinendophyticum]|uniref:Exopolysaccharide biosynthesis protein n=1 Tax=Rhizobium glycinendophyticum TaxID=2589807 RepID=A0A504UKB1_9HYPH|nr:exopolysaccharide biosynthesis protein [Rhizobium glycinendophyticum]TPP11155.1 exopolysaccharide biosynthesis protein [Rhizobium glycinendophyticum]